MSLVYQIFQGDASGGPVDFTAPVDTTSGLAWTTPAALAPGTVRRYAVRAFDGTRDDDGTDAQVAVYIDGAGNDVTDTPYAPVTLNARAGPAGTAVVTWGHFQPPGAVPPVGFRVWLTAGPTVNYAATPDATVAFVAGLNQYAAGLAGLADGTDYSIGVRAYNAHGTEGNTMAAHVTGRTTGPSAPDDLVATAE